MNEAPGSRHYRILAVPGSLRRQSWNRLLLQAAARSAPSNVIVTISDLRGIPPFDEDLEADSAGGPEPVRALRQQVGNVDGLLIATPEYNQSIPGVLKNAIDWLSRPGPDEVLAGLPVAIIGATAGSWGTRLAQQALRQVLVATESVVMPGPALFIRHAEHAFDDAGALADHAARSQLTAVLVAFANWVDRTPRMTG